MAPLVLLVVGIVVAQTWFDWRDAKKNWVVPEWVKGLALAGAIAVSLTAASSFASVWVQDAAGQSSGEFHSKFLWPELAFLICALGIIVVGVRKKRLPLMLMLTGVLAAAFWIGMSISS